MPINKTHVIIVANTLKKYMETIPPDRNVLTGGDQQPRTDKNHTGKRTALAQPINT
jgi:hypothetical protein